MLLQPTYSELRQNFDDYKENVFPFYTQSTTAATRPLPIERALNLTSEYIGGMPAVINNTIEVHYCAPYNYLIVW